MSKRRIILPVLFGVVGTAILIGLGVWQLQRMEWKQGVISELESRLEAEPVPLPEDPQSPRDDFLRVSVEGRLSGKELHLLTSLKPHGPGYRVIAPVETAGGRRLLVDLGYVPEDMKNPGDRPGNGAGAVSATGALYWPEETDSFTPPPDLDKNIWFARDLDAMAAVAGTEPLLVVAESHDLGEWPKPLRLGVNLPNDHLKYAITWFSLALIWAVMSVLLVRRERNRPA